MLIMPLFHTFYGHVYDLNFVLSAEQKKKEDPAEKEKERAKIRLHLAVANLIRSYQVMPIC